MPVRRGTVYEYSGAVGKVGVLVLTNDDWNDKVEEVGVVPIRQPMSETFPELHPNVSEAPLLQAIPGRLLSIDKNELGRPLVVLDDERLAMAEDVLCDILALDDICRPEPKRPPQPRGVVDYPAWGEIYYAGEPIDGQYKRWVVVSTDDWNKRTGTSILVRTTSQQRRGGPEFPPIQNGDARACCGDATTMLAKRVRLRGKRPDPRWLNTRDMAAIAEGITETHGLRGALERRKRP